MIPFIVSGLGVGAVYALSGVGLVVLYRASGVLNFAFGAIGALAAYVAWSVLAHEGAPLLAWACAVGSAMAVSLAYGWLLAPRLAWRDRTVRSMGTLGLALVVVGFTEWFWGEQPRRLLLPTDGLAFEFADVRLPYTRVMALALAAAMVGGVGLLLARSRLGLQMRALANDRDLSALLGVRVLQVDTVAWVLSGAFAGVCGLLLANMVRLQATYLTFLVIPAFAAAMLGRLHSLPLTALGGMAIGVVEALAVMQPDVAPYRTAVPFVAALVAICFFRTSARHA